MFLKILQLNKTWDSFILKDISFEIAEGSYFALLGPCGAGKTLLLNAIAGLYRPDAGNIFVEDREITFLPAEKRNIGYLFQKDALFPHLSVKENIYYGLRYRKPDTQYLDEILELLDIKNLLPRRDIINLSGGEIRKIALARSLAIKPRLLLLDEPLSFLDPISRQKVMENLKSLHKNGLTIVHVTHDIQEVRAFADRVAVLFNGAIAQVGTVNEILNQPAQILKEKFWGNNYA
jgi:ABC-type Fe3+/spermidine/putrescine transport system ATPase subunit